MSEKVDSSFKKYKLKRQLIILKNKKSEDGSTCLVSLYIPEGRQISDFTQQLTEELGTAANIKSKTTKKNVQAALQVTLGKLKKLPNKAPGNGLVLFTGVTTGSKMESYILNPTNPIEKKLYICDNKFHTQHLEDNLEDKKTYGLITLEAGSSSIAILTGSKLDIIRSMHGAVPKKHRAGGQSAARFGRLRDEAIDRFLKRIAERAKDIYLDTEEYEVKGLIIGGPGLFKNKLIQDGYLDRRLQKIVLKTFDLSYGSGKEGMNELVEYSKEVIEGVRFIEEKELVSQWLDHVYKDTGLASYGEKEIRSLFNQGAVNTLLLSEELDKTRVKVTCTQCNYTTSKTVESNKLEDFRNEIQAMKCPKCSSSLLNIVKTKDLVEDLGELAEQSGAKVEIISSDTEEGQELLHFTGITAILRYKVSSY